MLAAGHHLWSCSMWWMHEEADFLTTNSGTQDKRATVSISLASTQISARKAPPGYLVGSLYVENRKVSLTCCSVSIWLNTSKRCWLARSSLQEEIKYIYFTAILPMSATYYGRILELCLPWGKTRTPPVWINPIPIMLEQQSTTRASIRPQACMSSVWFDNELQVSGRKLAWVGCGSTLPDLLEQQRYTRTSINSHEFSVVRPYQTCLSNRAQPEQVLGNKYQLAWVHCGSTIPNLLEQQSTARA